MTHHDGERQICTVRTQSYFGASVVGGFGFVLAELENHDDLAHRVEVQVCGYNRGFGDVKSGRVLVLLPHERGRFFLPVPTP
ncbi:MAG: hypothetical protein ABIP94_21855, partial [Planctomycetota bacterium]